MNSFDLLRPKTIGDALRVLGAANPPVIKAGGVDLLDRMKEGLERPARVLDLQGFPELRAINEDSFDGKKGLNVGALVTLAELAASKSMRERATALAEAAHEAATPQVRAQATVGGNLHQHNRCWYYRSADFEPCQMRGGSGCPAKDGRNKIHAIFDTDGPCVAVDPSNLAPALVALDAFGVHSTLVEKKNEFSISIAKSPVANILVKGRNALASSSEGVLSNVFVPTDPERRSAYREMGERESFDWALASCAVSFKWKDGVCSDPRVVLGAVSLRVRRCEAAEKLLEGQKLTPKLARQAAEKALEGAKPLAENAYKIPVARALVARALLAAAGMEETK